MQIENNVDLRPFNTFGLPIKAATLIHIRREADIHQVLAHPEYGRAPKFILGGGSNIVPTCDLQSVVLKIEIMGRHMVQATDQAWIVEAGAGENWPDLVAWTLENDFPGLENLALIPGTAGAAPIQNIGAYGIELKDRFLSLDAVDLKTGRSFSLAAEQCGFDYRDSIFKRNLSGRCMITRVRLHLPKNWKPVLDYPDLQRLRQDSGAARPCARQVYEWVCALRRAKLPDPAMLGNAGSFFKNPIVNNKQHAAILACAPDMVSYPLPGGGFKLSAGWMIEACGWKGRRIGNVGVYARQALVLINHGGASIQELMALAAAIQDSVHQRFGIRLELEPTLI
ncbi:MAG: UDP-N-acetylmuramate dehydrogenase [Desulfobacteraceae bacterium]|nr:MAG: UDP-N-acetylmuramate dehydrogenase [Desulfobacteraceae bacterium]